jgi:hypothetical protein
MTQTEQSIHQALVDLEDSIADLQKNGTKPDFQGLFSRLDQLTAELPSGTDPQLLHYLHKKSYQKARLFLEGRDAENANGGCLRD